MRVTEQIDALETMAVSPIQYLVVPRVLAMTIVMPMLTMLFNMVGFLGAFVVSVYQGNINQGTFMGRIQQWSTSPISRGPLQAARLRPRHGADRLPQGLQRQRRLARRRSGHHRRPW